MTVAAAITGIKVYMIIFARMGGMIIFNPILARKNVPSQVKLALILGITVLITPGIANTAPNNVEGVALMFMMVQELLIGVACGFVFQVFYFLLFTAGDIVDMGFGLSMAKAFDPGTNIQASMSGNFFQLLFILYFFSTDCHLIFIKLMASSYDVVGIGGTLITGNTAKFLTELFVLAFSLVMQLAIPFIASCFILEFAMGILMKLIPQINVFTIHFQLKIIFGFCLMFLFAGPTSNFIQNYIQEMLVNIQNVFGTV